MIFWATGNTKAGKTVFATKMTVGSKNTVILDGDRLRSIWPGLDLSKEGRWEQNLRAARLAYYLEEQGLCVVVAVIAPYEDLRKQIEIICPGVKWVHMDHNQYKDDKSKPYESPSNPVITIRR